MDLPGVTPGTSLPLCDPHWLLCNVMLMVVSKGDGEVQSDDLGARRRPVVEEHGNIVADAQLLSSGGAQGHPPPAGLGVTHRFASTEPDCLDGLSCVHRAGPGIVSGVHGPQRLSGLLCGGCVGRGALPAGPRGIPAWRSILAHTPSVHRRGRAALWLFTFLSGGDSHPCRSLLGQSKAHGHGEPPPVP